jgi:hypothetical protein
MSQRDGKYGPFLFCTAGKHGTISVEKAKLLQLKSQSTGRISEYLSTTNQEHDLMFQVKKQTMLFGFQPTELEEWIVDGDIDDPDNWQNLRPY